MTDTRRRLPPVADKNTEPANPEKRSKVRKREVGPFKMPAVLTAAGESREDLVGRAKRHYREVAQGRRPEVDVDASIRQGPRRPAPRPLDSGGRRFMPPLFRGDEDDDD